MEVSHKEDHVTHAVITSNQAQGFGMSDSAEFFNILSSTLYKNPTLAVIRETLCNAWDAHIDAGLQHLPIEVTLTSERLVIRDFGKGIHRDKMRDIYCVYGSSTKTHDGKQTGGFGLGCKAPFAYADHFEVISNHGGTKTIWNLSKSNAQAGGKPGIIELASVPTEDTGIQVTIDLIRSQDMHEFKSLIRTVAFRGDIPVKLNGDLLPVLGFDLKKSNVMVLPYGDLSENSVMVRYGNVLYPVEARAGIGANRHKVCEFLERLQSRYHASVAIIFQAPPHSISVQPSREGLSMKEHTINTLNQLMEAFLKQIDAEFSDACAQERHAEIAREVQTKDMHKLFRYHLQYDWEHRGEVPVEVRKAQTIPEMAKRAMAVKYPSHKGFQERDIMLRARAMTQAGMLDRGMVQSYLKDLEAAVKMECYKSDWFTRRIAAPLLVKLKEAGLEDWRLYAKTSYSSKERDETLSGLKHTSFSDLKNVFPYLRNIVVVTHKLTHLQRRIDKTKETEKLGMNFNFLVYHTGTSKADKEKALAFFREQKMVVIDLTVNQAWEDVGRSAPALKKPKKIGWPSMADMIGGRGDIVLRRIMLDDVRRNDKPEFAVDISLGRHEPESWFSGWSAEASMAIIQLWGDKGVVTNNSGQYKKIIKQGAKPMRNYVQEKLKDYILNSKTLTRYWSIQPERLMRSYGGNDDGNIIRTLTQGYKDPVLQKAFGLPKGLSKEDQAVLAIWASFSKRHYGIPENLKEVAKFIEAQPLDPKAVQMKDNLVNNPLLSLLKLDQLDYELRVNPPGSPKRATYVKVLHLLLNP